MIPWRPLSVFVVISAGTTAAIAALTASNAWTVHSPAWGVLGPIAMWAPAVARFVARRTVDTAFDSTLRLSRWGTTGARVVLVPLALPLMVYGVAYFIASVAGMAYWNPGGGRWTSASQ